MAHKPDGKFVNDIEQRGEIKHMLSNAVHGAGGPCAVSVSAQINSIDVIMLPQRTRHPVPVARMIKPTMDEHQRGFAILPVIPELELKAVRIKKVRDRFHVFRHIFWITSAVLKMQDIFYRAALISVVSRS